MTVQFFFWYCNFKLVTEECASVSGLCKQAGEGGVFISVSERKLPGV